MGDLLDKIIEAKEIKGDDAAIEIAKHLNILNYDESKMKGSCPFGHSDSTPSFIWNKKDKCFTCFSCGKRYSILDMYTETEGSYFSGIKRLFKETNIAYNFKGQKLSKEEYFLNYKYPKIETNTELENVIGYLGKRGISEKTIRYAGIKQDIHGNIVFESHDLDGTLLSSKYRKAGKVLKGQPKMWYQKDASNCPILYNIDKVDITKPLVITEGECYTGDTEILTPEGWIRLDQYDGQQVMQVHEDMTGDFITPLAYVKHEYDGDMYYRDNITSKLAVTANHNMVYVDYNGKVTKRKASEMPKNIGRKYIPTVINYDGPGIPLTDEQIALYIAVCADCTIDIRQSTGHRHSRFGVKKDRKYTRMKSILDRLGIEYFDNPNAKDGYKYIGFVTPNWIKNKYLPQEWLYLATKRQKQFILNELIEWDGNNVINRNQVEFSSKFIENAELVQSLAVTLGYGSSIMKRHNNHGVWYRVNIRYNNNHVTFQDGWDKIEHYNGMVYCVTVPTGMILVRYKGKTLVCGNCDTLSIIEAGWNNVASIPRGSADTGWIEFNYEFLENFETIILWFDNDSAGQNGLNNTIKRMGEYRCKIIRPETIDEDNIEKYYQKFNSDVHIRKTDANNILLACGKDRIIQLINTAEDIPVKNISYLMDAKSIPIDELEKFPTGISGIDDIIYGNIFPSLTIYSGSAGCVDADTEFFDGTKWKRIADYQQGDKVLQYNEDNTAVLVNPEQYHKYKTEYLWHFKTKYGIDQCLSEEHNVPYITSKGNLNFKKFSDLKNQHESTKGGFTGRFITSFRYSGKGIDLSDSKIKLMCAVICDGSFYKNMEYSLNADSYMRCRFHIKKDRKKKKLRELFEECGINWREKKSANDGYVDFYINAPRREKVFSDYWYNCNQHQLQVICDNILFWDGADDGVRKSFFSNVKENADFIQFAFTACGYRATVIENNRIGEKRISKYNNKVYTRKTIDYTINITKRTLISMTTSNGKPKTEIYKYKTTDGFKYCFTVPSHMWVMRRNGRIAITGNSGKSSLANIATVISAIEHGEKAFIYSGELAPSQLSDWILSPLAGYNHIMEFNSEEYARSFFRVTDQAESNIRKFYRSNILLYNDNGSLETSSNEIFNAMEIAYRKFGCRVFLIDNLMSLSLEGESVDSKWEAQKKFIVKLANFTNKYGVNVNLVAHPRKPSGGQNINDASVYSLSGSSDLGNICHRMFWVSRIKDETLPQDIGKLKIEIVKDRPTQSGGQSCEAYYDKKTRRIYTNEEEKNKIYKWESQLKNPINYPNFVKEKLIKNKKHEMLEECDQF